MTTKIKSGVIGDGVVGTTQIADDAITSAKLDTNIAVAGTLTVTGDANFDSNTLFVDSSANAVGIGTSSPDADLSLLSPFYASGGAGNGIRFQNQNNNADAIIQSYYSGTSASALFSAANAYVATSTLFTSFDNTKASAFVLINTNGSVEFGNATSGNPTTKMLLDSSGNLLVGTTDTTLWNDNADNYGHNILGNGQYYSSTNGEINAYLNRQNSDGAILAFAKDGTPVGSIGTGYGSIDIKGGTSGLLMGNAAVLPVNASGTLTDGSYDIGLGSYRFKDLYLSGTASVGHVIPNTQGTYSINHLGVYSGGITVNAATSQTGYLMSAGTGIVAFGPSGGSIRLGGTAAANELDDYEEGTWTPTLSFGNGTTGIGYNQQSGTYTKIGNIVCVNFTIYISSKGSSSGIARVASLPYAVGFNNHAFFIYSDRVTFTGGVLAGYIGSGSTITLYNQVSGSNSSLSNSEFANDSYISGVFTYTTNG